eukprot:11515524-Alexandrium_andersonii.AAC.1
MHLVFSGVCTHALHMHGKGGLSFADASMHLVFSAPDPTRLITSEAQASTTVTCSATATATARCT